MSVLEIILMSVALAMDACAVAMTDGMTDSKMPAWRAVVIGVSFGFFQFAMPVVGYFITGLVKDAFLHAFEVISGWVSFGLLAFLGGKMLFECISEIVKEKRKKEQTEGAGTGSDSVAEKKLSFLGLIVQAIATSIDALAIGVVLQTEGSVTGVWGSTAIIGVVTFALSVGAVYIGKLVGNKLADKAGIFGGAVLLGIGVKILIESLI